MTSNTVQTDSTIDKAFATLLEAADELERIGAALAAVRKPTSRVAAVEENIRTATADLQESLGGTIKEKRKMRAILTSYSSHEARGSLRSKNGGRHENYMKGVLSKQEMLAILEHIPQHYWPAHQNNGTIRKAVYQARMNAHDGAAVRDIVGEAICQRRARNR